VKRKGKSDWNNPVTSNAPGVLACAAFCILLGLFAVPSVSAARSTTADVALAVSRQISLAHARSELARQAYFTCPTAGCKHRTYDCRRRSPFRIECRSELLERWEEETQAGELILLYRELCRWTAVATPFHGSTKKLRTSDRHFRCRHLAPGESWSSVRGASWLRRSWDDNGELGTKAAIRSQLEN
jgi:hypothetical protein